MKRLLFLILAVLLLAGCATVSTSGQFTLGRGKTLRGSLLVTSGHATLEEDSRVTGSVFVTSGTLDVRADAEIEGDVFVTSGNVHLGPRAVVRGDVITTSGRVTRAEGARVEGKIDTSGFSLGANIIGAFCLPPLILFAVFVYWLVSQARRRGDAERAAAYSVAPILGLVLILIGAVILVQNLTDWDIGNWWALLVLIPAVGSLANAWGIVRAEGRLSAAARGPLVSGGALLLVTAIFLFDLSWLTLWPLFLIIFGVGVLVAR